MALGGRIATETILNNPHRAELLSTIRASPGIHLREAQRQTGLAWGEFVHHVRLLQRASLVHLENAGTRIHLFSVGKAPHECLHSLGATAQRVLAYIEAHDAASSTEVAVTLGISDRLARYHLSRLAERLYIRSDKNHPPRYRSTRL